MTNEIGTGTCNFTINMHLDERAEWGRLANRTGFRSVGDFFRTMILRGAETLDAETAARVREIRRKYYGTVALLALFCAAIIGGVDDMRRPSMRTSARRGRDEQFEMAA